MTAFEDAEWDLVVDDEVEAIVRGVLPMGSMEGEIVDVPARFHRVLGQHGYGGAVVITGTTGDGPVRERVQVRRIDAEPTGDAAERRVREAADAGS